MGNEDFIDLGASSGSGGGSDNNELRDYNFEPSVVNFQPNFYHKEDAFNKDNLGQGKVEIINLDEQHTRGTYLEKDMVDKPPNLDGSVELIETVSIGEKMNGTNGCLHSENDSPTGQKESTSSHKIDGSRILCLPVTSLVISFLFFLHHFLSIYCISACQPCPESPDCLMLFYSSFFWCHDFHNLDVPAISGVKRARLTYDDQQPSVRVIYSSLSRKSKRKLEELLHHWSEWHAQQCSSNDSNEVLVSGEETYYPAIYVGPGKSSTVSFLMDNQLRKKQSKEFISLDGDSVPLYDRGYALGLTSVDGLSNQESGLETHDASRCFNCGSYNHSLKDCPKLRDNAAVNNARKQHQAKKNHAPGPRSLTRYYQNSPGGKYDGLKPGVLSAETRQLLGLGELDPPPWLFRMRELGYPPGYLDLEDEDQPSGITIYADEETNGEQDGEILNSHVRKPWKKMSVDFPGMNALIPENADQRKWAAFLGSPSLNYSRNQSNHSSNYSSEGIPRGQFYAQRWPRDYRDGGSPGYNLGVSPPMSGYSLNYANFDLNYTSDSLSPRGHIPIPRSPSLGRSLSDGGRRSSLVHEGSPFDHDSPYSFLPYSSLNSWQHYESHYY
ncbi:hypothetical protein L1049_007275 [Liquidambar formosana]|uniref:CCHC-type domain-containing protein n=1 Tax=Liquidambar formosana TaxID=63359 RepID=A0AAP0RIH3_LIQFO